jgi:hypothetical protein
MQVECLVTEFAEGDKQMPIYMKTPTPDEMPNPQGPSAEASDYLRPGGSGDPAAAQVDYFSPPHPDGDNAGFQDIHHPGGANAGPGGGPHIDGTGIIGPERRRGGALSILIGLLIFSVAGILIGLLLFLFAPAGIAGGAAGILIGDKSGGDSCTTPAPENVAGVIAINQPGSEAMVNGDSNPLQGILIGLDGFRTSMGGESFFQSACSQPTEFQAEPPPSPTNVPGTDPTKTPIPANNPNGQQPNTSGGGGDQPNEPTDPCLPDNGGIASYEPNYCNCNGTTSTIIFCQDGRRIETTNPGGSCQPDPGMCQQPSTDGGGQQTPTCEYKCYVSDPNKPEQCLQGGWVYPGTDNYCDPQNP